jgi:hypothetical protein
MHLQLYYSDTINSLTHAYPIHIRYGTDAYEIYHVMYLIILFSLTHEFGLQYALIRFRYSMLHFGYVSDVSH